MVEAVQNKVEDTAMQVGPRWQPAREVKKGTDSLRFSAM